MTKVFYKVIFNSSKKAYVDLVKSKLLYPNTLLTSSKDNFFPLIPCNLQLPKVLRKSCIVKFCIFALLHAALKAFLKSPNLDPSSLLTLRDL